MTIGERIKKARKDAKLTQKDLGEKIGVSGSMIGQWENDLRCPKMETLQKIASALDVNITNLSSDINTLFHQITDAILESEPEIAKEFERIDRQTEHKFNLLKMFEVCLNTYSWKIRVEEIEEDTDDLDTEDSSHILYKLKWVDSDDFKREVTIPEEEILNLSEEVYDFFRYKFERTIEN